MTMDKDSSTSDATVKRMVELAENNFNCSQIVMALALEREGKNDPDLIRAVGGLGDGCGFLNETCGILTGSACMLSWYAGKGYGDEEVSGKLLPMLQDLGDWFEKEIDGFSTLFHQLSFEKVGTSTIQSRAFAGVASGTYIFCVPGSPGACRDAWEGILKWQLDNRHRPCNFVEIMPRLEEHRRGGS